MDEGAEEERAGEAFDRFSANSSPFIGIRVYLNQRRVRNACFIRQLDIVFFFLCVFLPAGALLRKIYCCSNLEIFFYFCVGMIETSRFFSNPLFRQTEVLERHSLLSLASQGHLHSTSKTSLFL